ncbi:hypothetical protein MRB53_038131 [Persea americana]|nr:hypothetical protein MRB53_038131 [Persea americana]
MRVDAYVDVQKRIHTLHPSGRVQRRRRSKVQSQELRIVPKSRVQQVSVRPRIAGSNDANKHRQRPVSARDMAFVMVAGTRPVSDHSLSDPRLWLLGSFSRDHRLSQWQPLGLSFCSTISSRGPFWFARILLLCT